MSRCCSQCGSNGHNARTCAVESSGVSGDGGSGEIMLFGVRVRVDPMRKSVSMNDLSHYEQPHESPNAENAAAGYASADDAVHHHSSGNRERKRGIPWTEEEHKLFLLGLQRVGKGDWRGISKKFVKTRTPTQVASHAQKYFLRRSNLNRRRRRSSLFDITTDSVAVMPMEEEQVHRDNASSPRQPENSLVNGFPVLPFPVTAAPALLPIQTESPAESLTLGQVDEVKDGSTKGVRPIPFLLVPDESTTGDLNINPKLMMDPSPLSLNLSLSSDQNQSSRQSAFQVVPSFLNGDGIISVA